LKKYSKGADLFYAEKAHVWAKGNFSETIDGVSGVDAAKMRTFHMKHDEEMDYICKKCRTKISAHNHDWHNRMCDKCFNREYDMKN